MSTFRITLTIDNITDSTEIKAESRDQALLLAGATLGASMVISAPSAALTYQLLGISAVQGAVEETLREEISELTVEEL